MTTRGATNRNRGFTQVELLVVIGVLAVVAALLLPALAAAKRKHSRIGCVNYLKITGIAFRLWEGDNGDKYPMQFALTNSETMKLLAGTIQLNHDIE